MPWSRKIITRLITSVKFEVRGRILVFVLFGRKRIKSVATMKLSGSNQEDIMSATPWRLQPWDFS
jgi:hypothetical protein